LGPCPTFALFCLPAAEDFFLGMVPRFFGVPEMFRTTLAPSVAVGASAAWMGLAALAAFAACLFHFLFSAGVS